MSKGRSSRGIYARRFKHGVSWYIRFTFEGREVKELVGREADGITRTVARDALKVRLGDIARGRFSLPTARRSVSFRVLVARYSELAAGTKRAFSRERYVLNSLVEYSGTLPCQL